jgi:ATP-dependent RNA helicase DeaD
MNGNSFEELIVDERILKAVRNLGFKKPSKVQEKVIPRILDHNDIIVKSQTGSGKTAAFGIPICDKLIIEEKSPQALVLTPTRELAVQIKEEISNIGRYKKLRAAAIFGKQPMDYQKNLLRQRVHVIVGTPGRTLDHIDKGNINLERIKYLVIDEADEMLSMGFIDQVEAIIHAIPKSRITMLFSATMPEKIEVLCKKYMCDPENIEINPENIIVNKIKQYYIEVNENAKLTALNRILYTENPDSCILFCKTKENVDEVHEWLKSGNYPCAPIHGGMLQNERLEVMQKFKRGEFRFLIATDVAARGIDVEDITHVINYDVPVEKERYVHRIGRTGRAGKEGTAITFVTSKEVRFFTELQNYIGFDIEEKDLPTREEAEKLKPAFIAKNIKTPTIKLEKSIKIKNDVEKIYIGAGKDKKLRAGDIVGAITSINGIEAESIGIIDVQDRYSHVDILDGKGDIVVEGLKNAKVKGKVVKVEKARR